MSPRTSDEIARAFQALGQAGVSAQHLAKSLRGLGQAWQDAQASAVQRRAPSPLPGHLCEQCLDAPAVRLVHAPWGGDMGVCKGCALASLRHVEAQALAAYTSLTGLPPRPETLRVTWVERRPGADAHWRADCGQGEQSWHAVGATMVDALEELVLYMQGQVQEVSHTR